MALPSDEWREYTRLGKRWNLAKRLGDRLPACGFCWGLTLSRFRGSTSGFRLPTRCGMNVIPATWGAVRTLQYGPPMRLLFPFVLALVVVTTGRTALASVGPSAATLVMPAGVARLVMRDAGAH